ncbi:MAG: DEAD/DEAH box helicase, partial [Pyrinomonadaceae bacterium]|nr:DEAD/DEAH box helicase [Pyrinomonadaceae bacterium]
GWEYLLPLLNTRKGSVFDYLPKDCVLIFDEPATVENNLTTFYQTLTRRFIEIDKADELALEPREIFLTADELREKMNAKQCLEFRALGRTAASDDEQFSVSESTNQTSNLFLFSTSEKAVEVEISSRPSRRYHNRIAELVQNLKSRAESEILFVFQTRGIAERFKDLLREQDFSLERSRILIGNLSSGFELPLANLIVHNEGDIFDEVEKYEVHPEFQAQNERNKTSQTKTKKSRTGAFLSDFRDLKSGDFVVHVDHGVGRFDGLQTLDLQGTTSEFMILVYADNAKLFVPVERLDLVQRYSSAEAGTPGIDRLGSVGWQQKKAKAKRQMRDMADELLRLYAERKLVQGYAFSIDSPWQDEFETAFPYDLTVDQISSIDDIKRDMETQTPMDRLLCGDVGFGKTEVAMRAAFKAAMDSKQVAVLTPTTVLSYQHFETFKKRFAAFPITIDLLSRFRNPKQQKETVKLLEEGKIDIIIGTHRLLSKDVSVPKLGLVIVDEEQRFGVAHKEKLKQLKKKVDVLTLSATPIPRTLSMSLNGMRDMSLIETPPRDRLSINTQVVQFGENVIKSA